MGTKYCELAFVGHRNLKVSGSAPGLRVLHGVDDVCLRAHDAIDDAVRERIPRLHVQRPLHVLPMDAALSAHATFTELQTSLPRIPHAIISATLQSWPELENPRSL